MTVQRVEAIDEVRRIRHAVSDQRWGLVPTMGALHAGHLSLVRQALKENDRVAVSIFVNPTQFNEAADLAHYPRRTEEDLAALDALGVDLVWLPKADEMYPPGYQTYITMEPMMTTLEGAARPGHFRGVATVVAKLLNVVAPHRAYFGQKDAQQVVVIRQLVRDLGFNVEIVACPTVREPDGLAMSSRNLLLTAEQRVKAPVLHRALSKAAAAWEGGQCQAEQLRTLMRTTLEREPLARIDYVSVADPVTLEELYGPVEQALLSMAVFFGEVRLIDNMQVGT